MSTKNRIQIIEIGFWVGLIIFWFFPGEGNTGAWTQKKGDYFFKLSVNYLFADKEFNHRGEKVNILEDFEVYRNATFTDLSLIAYLEYGLFDRLTVVSNLPYKISWAQREELSNYFRSRKRTLTSTGFSDWTIAGRYLFLRNPIVLSAQIGVKLPLGYKKTPDNEGPALGTGEMDGEGQLLIGKSLYPLPIYMTSGIGYRSRRGALNDEYVFMAEVGYSRGPVVLKVAIDGVKNTHTPPDLYGSLVVSPLPGGGGTIPDILYGDQDYTKVSPGIIFKFNDEYGIQFDAIHIIAGKNIISGTIFSLGIVKIKSR
ncbi:MAG: hypothetical protein Kow0042_16550 [Calditrichia bacterium]